MLVPWNRDFWHNFRAGHPAGRRCSSLTYVQYAHSSRLARRAPRSGPCASYHVSRGLVAVPSQSRRLAAVQLPVIPIVARWIAETPGTISLGQGVVSYGPPPEAVAASHRFG